VLHEALRPKLCAAVDGQSLFSLLLLVLFLTRYLLSTGTDYAILYTVEGPAPGCCWALLVIPADYLTEQGELKIPLFGKFEQR